MGKNGRRWLIFGGLAAVAALGYAGWANRRLFVINDITTGESALYPRLRSRVYYADAPAVVAAAEQAIRSLPRWQVVRRDVENDALDAEAGTPIGPFIDDVTIYAVPLGHGQTRAIIRSRSRLGRGDLGQNAAHILELQAAMDRRLNADAAF